MLLFRPITLAVAIAASAQAAATPDRGITGISVRDATAPEYHPNVKDPGGLPPCHGTAVARRLAREDIGIRDLEILDVENEAAEPNVYTDKRATYPSNYIPAKCNQQGFNCV